MLDKKVISGKEQESKGEGKGKKVKSKISKILIIIGILVVILVVTFLLYQFVFRKTSTVDYNENVKSYGFESMYDNKSSKATEQVTKSELIKMVVSTTLNTEEVYHLVELKSFIEDYDEKDPDALASIATKLSYPNQIWVEYANSVGLVERNVVTKENEKENATLLDALVYFSKAKRILLDKALDTKEGLNIKNIESFNVGEQLAIHDMVSNGIIENKEYAWKNAITKGELNQLLIDFANKYNTITVGDEKININKEKEPSNASEYPYTLASVKKDVYEIKNYVAAESTYKNARNAYAEIKKYFYEINTLVSDYYGTILNIDYTTIKEEQFIESVQSSTLYRENNDTIKEYVKYVKDNQIKMSGTAQIQYPAIYFDGENTRVRVKITYKITEAKNKQNLLYQDLQANETISYDKDEETIIVDIPIGKAVTSDTIYVVPIPQRLSVAGKVVPVKEAIKTTILDEEESIYEGIAGNQIESEDVEEDIVEE